VKPGLLGDWPPLTPPREGEFNAKSLYKFVMARNGDRFFNNKDAFLTLALDSNFSAGFLTGVRKRIRTYSSQDKIYRFLLHDFK
jgi:hypothetical protein